MFTAAPFIIIKIWKRLMCPPTDEWMKKCGRCICNGILFSPKNEENLPIATTWMDLIGIMLHKMSQRMQNTI